MGGVWFRVCYILDDTSFLPRVWYEMVGDSR